MNDGEARHVINLLTKRINYLDKKIQQLEHPHSKDCKCDMCTGWHSDPMLISVGKDVMGFFVKYEWWKDTT